MISRELQFVSPLTGKTLEHNDEFYYSSGNERYPIINGIPWFSPEVNYTDSFGFQWNIFDKTQLDNYSNSGLSYNRFYAQTNWDPLTLDALNILEVGSGAGRFTEVLLSSTKATLYSIDYSSAVEANFRNNARFGSRLVLAQASIYEMPFKNNIFDKVFCFGVLQHTPSFEKSIKMLVEKTKVGGEIVVDFYPIKGWFTKIHSKYLLRPITKRLPRKILISLIRVNISWMLLLFDTLCRLNLAILTRFIPITDIRGFPLGLPSSKRREWAIMDTFDAFSPEFDKPQRLSNVIKMFRSSNCAITFAGTVEYSGGSTMIVRAIKE